MNENSEKYHLNVYQFIRLNGEWRNWSMILVEEYPCDNYNQALARERHWCEQLNGDLNTILPIRTEEESKELPKIYLKKYSEKNKEALNQKSKEYYENNKEILNQKKKEYRENNKELLKEKAKENRDKKERINCECGGCFLSYKLSQHLKTKMHIAFEASK
jgi:hypothetical protein